MSPLAFGIACPVSGKRLASAEPAHRATVTLTVPAAGDATSNVGMTLMQPRPGAP